MKIGFLASHGGSNMQAIIDACRSGHLSATPVVVISNNRDSGALVKAREAGIPGHHLSGATHPDAAELDRAILEVLERYGVEVLVLAGYMKKLGPLTLARFSGAILNIHPSLLPKFGGQGMFGIRVHQAVLAAGEAESGVSVHLVDADYDTGPVLAQRRVPVLPGDSPEQLAVRVLRCEHELYPAVLQQIASGRLRIPGYQPPQDVNTG